MRFFVTEKDTITTKVLVDTSGSYPRVLVQPQKRFVLGSELFGEKPEQRQAKFDELQGKYEKDVALATTVTLEFTWQYWGYELRSSIYRDATVENARGERVIDQDLLNKGKVRKLLVGWNLMDEGKAIPVVRDSKTKELDAATLKLVLSLEPAILLAAINKLDDSLYPGFKDEEEKN